ncbi:Peptidyl-prolyl cis-trans isomerase FKBP5 [Hondaea fermentalgiana]|uniref:RNA polymerase II-associated protein 3 n=1 Tax=Hondaea fermentalgiana TaxID=2315210 RepID=A0A2R5G9H6_9STRA|nr:Peptidyl-prolyl cis-trans isomerase FKBP5 [Hondaea fermentalgiana]|eukprot:GBG24721.1 Peptidyl-prolyl cis-trans isomerase FKBP5 [Hondaea fermentalgiana]
MMQALAQSAGKSAKNAQEPEEALPDVPVEHLDYGYIEKCKDADELRDILRVLQSGKEGRWYELERACEKKMVECMPAKERTLYVAQHTEPSDQDKQRAASDLTSFLESIAQRDASLRGENGDARSPTSRVETENGPEAIFDVVSESSTRPAPHKERSLPPVRGTSGAEVETKSAPKTMISHRTPDEVKEEERRRQERISGYDFRAWDKYDVENELKRIDEEDQAEAARKAERIAARQAAIDERQKRAERSRAQLGLPENLEDMSADQRTFHADREREKGNECFRALEFEASLRHYSRCVLLMPPNHTDARPFANRAMALLKLERWAEAERDCDAALEVDASFTKAYIRRGMARHRRGKYLDAIDDFEEALQHEPRNTKLNGLLAESRKMYNKVGGIGAERPGAPARDGEGGNKKPETFKKLMIMEDSDSEDSDSEDDESEAKIDVEANAKVSDGLKSQEGENEQQQQQQQSELSLKESVKGSGASESEPPSPEEEYVLIDTAAQIDDWVEAKRRGAEMFAKKDFRNALAWFSRACEILRAPVQEGSETSRASSQQDLCNCLGNMAVCNKELARWNEVVQICDGILELQKDNIKALFRRGVALEELGRFEDALQDMCQILRLEPERAEAGDRIAALLAKLNSASASTKSSPPVPPVTPAAPSAIDVNTTAQSLPSTTAKAAPAASVKATSDPAKVPVEPPVLSAEETLEQIKAKGNDLFKTGDLEGALRKYQQCLDLDGTNVSVLANIAMVCLQQEEYQQAADAATKALNRASKSDKIYAKLLYRRALAKKALHNLEGALTDLQGILEIEPRNSRVQAEISQVQKLQRVETEKKRIEERRAKQAEAEELAKRAHARAAAKSSAKGRPAFSVPASGYEFQRVWRSLTASERAAYLAAIPSTQFAKIFRVELEDDTLMEMVSAIDLELIPKEMDVAQNILRALANIPRFATTIKFLSKSQRAVVQATVNKAEDPSIAKLFFPE